MEAIESMKFEEMNLSPEILKAIEDMGFEEATPIQAQSISVIQSGADVIGQSQTGSGKTAAFGIPCLEKIDPNSRKVQALILSPTRELAIQISEEIRKLLKYKTGVKVLPVYGGQPIDRQILALKKGVQVIIGTPGRVMDHMRRKTIRLNNINMFVLDEADEMLDMGFREDIETILEGAPEDRQTILFSATMPPEILALTKKYQNNPEFIKIVRKELTAPSIDQIYYEVKEKSKLDALCRIIDMDNPRLTLVFCNTKRGVDDLAEQLQGRGYFAEGLHGDLKQAQRDKVMNKFRKSTIEILVATDVAARGIDVDDIDLVINYDIPQDEEYYVHRIGRTGRAGRDGKACTFVVGREIFKLRDIMTYAKADIRRGKLPRLRDVENVKFAAHMQRVKAAIEQGHLSKYISLIENHLEDEDFSELELAAALLKMQFAADDDEDFVEGLERELKDEWEIRKQNKSKKDKDSKDGKRFKSGDKDKMVKLFINVGSENNVRAKDVVGAIAGETGLQGKVIGSIDIHDDYTFVEVPKKHAKDIMQKMKNIRIRGNKIKIEQAKK